MWWRHCLTTRDRSKSGRKKHLKPEGGREETDFLNDRFSAPRLLRSFGVLSLLLPVKQALTWLRTSRHMCISSKKGDKDNFWDLDATSKVSFPLHQTEAREHKRHKDVASDVDSSCTVVRIWSGEQIPASHFKTSILPQFHLFSTLASEKGT